MNILTHYMLAEIKYNKRRFIAILMILTLASTLISLSAMFLPTLLHDNIEVLKVRTGNWHLQVDSPITANQARQLEKNPAVSAIYFDSTPQVAHIANANRPYLVWQNTSPKSFSAMPEAKGKTISAGRAPEKANEIAVNASFLRENDYHLNDVITADLGYRQLDNRRLKPNSVLTPTETFVTTGSQKWTIVGILDQTIPSALPYQIGISAMPLSSAPSHQSGQVFVQLHNPRDAYRLIPQLAKTLNLAKIPPSGRYPVRHYPILDNTPLLSAYFTYPPSLWSGDLKNIAQTIFLPASLLLMLCLICGIFGILIASTFQAWEQERLKSWGLLKSIGATPQQIRHTLLLEGGLLALLPAAIGFLLARLIAKGGLYYLTTLDNARQDIPLALWTPWPLTLTIFLLNVIIILVAARTIGKKVARRSPLSLLRPLHGMTNKKYKRRNKPIKSLNFSLAKTAINDNKKFFRTSLLALSLSLVLYAVLNGFLAMNFATNEAYYDKLAQEAQITLMTTSGDTLKPQLRQQLLNIPGVLGHYQERRFFLLTKVKAEQESKALNQLGGLKKLAEESDEIRQTPEGYQMELVLRALPDQDFAAYCQQLQLSPQAEADDTLPIIFYNHLPITEEGKPHNPEATTFCVGDTLSAVEKHEDKPKDGHPFSLQIIGLSDELPPWKKASQFVNLNAFLSDSSYQHLLQQLSSDAVFDANQTTFLLRVDPKKEKAIYHQIQTLLKEHYASADYELSSIAVMRENAQEAMAALYTIAITVSGLIALFGIIAAFVTVRQSIYIRRRHFLLLQSTGLDRRGLYLLILSEGLCFALIPLFFGIIGGALFLLVSTLVFDVSFIAILSHLPWLQMIAFVVVTIGAILAAYHLGFKILEERSLSEYLREDAI